VFQILWIVIGGAIIGLIARALMRNRSVPLWATVCLGILGALIGNVIAGGIGVRNTSGIDWIRHVLQIGVACGLIALVGPFTRRRGGGGGGPSLFAGSGRGTKYSRDRSHIDMH
jgi:uncharacterized membrane protein YeaQ/YmgE (transglycosylase-associated protein family)